MKEAFAPSIVRSRLYDLVVCDDIIFYLELFQVTYDDLELVAVLIVLCSYASHDCHQTMWHIHFQNNSRLCWYDGWAGCVTWFHVYHEPLFVEMISYATSSRSNETKHIWGIQQQFNTFFIEMSNSNKLLIIISHILFFFFQDRAPPPSSRRRPPPPDHIARWGIQE